MTGAFQLHIGHHFFGAGNLGDDFLLAGFLSALPKGKVDLTCCVPHPREPLKKRFPEVTWRPYDRGGRERSVSECDAWLGLGGSPFQSAVSRWFVDHLAEEAVLCQRFGKPMYFLGVGGQDPAAYALPELQSVIRQAQTIWTRDAATAEAVSKVRGGNGNAPADQGRDVRIGADLAHLFFASNPPPSAAAGRLTAVINFDYADWPGLPPMMEAIRSLPGTERIWLAQESRELPGAERTQYERLSAEDRKAWRLTIPDNPALSLKDVLTAWPSGERLLTSRYHAALAGAWAGSRGVILAVNDKLRAAAAETGFESVELAQAPDRIRVALENARPASRARLESRAELARQSCGELFKAIQ